MMQTQSGTFLSVIIRFLRLANEVHLKSSVEIRSAFEMDLNAWSECLFRWFLCVKAKAETA